MYFPLNLEATVYSSQKVQSLCSTCMANMGGWWLTCGCGEGGREGGRKSHFCSIHIETSEANTGGCRYTCTLYIQYMYKITLYIHVMEFTLLVCTCRFPNRCHMIRISAVTFPPLIMQHTCNIHILSRATL